MGLAFAASNRSSTQVQVSKSPTGTTTITYQGDKPAAIRHTQVRRHYHTNCCHHYNRIGYNRRYHRRRYHYWSYYGAPRYYDYGIYGGVGFGGRFYI
jgi:hypothetical protein